MPSHTNSSDLYSLSYTRRILQTEQSSITSKTYNLLAFVHTWPAFSNHTPGHGGSTCNSLEAIHDCIHINVGGNGHMGDTAVAGILYESYV